MYTIVAHEGTDGIKKCMTFLGEPSEMLPQREELMNLIQESNNVHESISTDFAFKHFLDAGMRINAMIVFRDNGRDFTYTYAQYVKNAPWMSGSNN